MSEKPDYLFSFCLFDRVDVSVKFLWRDLWLGVYVEKPDVYEADEENPHVSARGGIQNLCLRRADVPDSDSVVCMRLRPVFGKPIRKQARIIERQAMLDLKTIKTRRKMTDDEIRAAVMLNQLTYLPGSSDKRFARSICGIAHTSQMITEAQVLYLWRMVYRYRRQISNKVLVTLADKMRRASITSR